MPVAPVVVLYVDDDSLARDIVAASCTRRGIAVVAKSGELTEAVELCGALRPDVVVTSEAVARTALTEPRRPPARASVKIIVLSAEPGPCPLSLLLADNIWGHLSHDASPDQVVDAILAVAEGGMALDPLTATTVVQQWRLLCGRRA